LFARVAGGRWLVRMEDIDTPRVVAGCADDILGALRRYGLEWDGDVEWQSRRTGLYADALRRLAEHGLVFDCGCSRKELARIASAPAAVEMGQAGDVYRGRCRNGVPEGAIARAVRFRAPSEVIHFDDVIFGRVSECVEQVTGDFVVRRADGLFAYQLAVVVDDADQGVTQVVRGADLLSSTPRQIALQRALGLPTPAYAHLPLVLNPDGSKLSKRDAALPLPSLDERTVAATLAAAFRFLGIEAVAADRPSYMLTDALGRFDPAAIGRASHAMPSVQAGADRENSGA
jgi:glutamyl-Q tRNA(Asp) synthetase